MIRVEHIEFLVKAGMKVLKIYEDENNANAEERFSWWIVNSFASARVTGEEGTEFHTVVGMEVTDFFNTNHIIHNEKEFLNKLQEVLEQRRTLTCKFHHSLRWKQYVSSI